MGKKQDPKITKTLFTGRITVNNNRVDIFKEIFTHIALIL